MPQQSQGATSPEADTSTSTDPSRRATRAKGEARRRQILEATLRIAARDGIRGVKHRPVAKEAGVPLASTTYYFKDIDELITDAFMLFAEKAYQNLELFERQLFGYLDRPEVAETLKTAAGQLQVAERVAELAAAYMYHQLNNRKQDILMEQVFLLEATREAHLERLAREYRDAWITTIAGILERLGNVRPKRDAAMIVSVAVGLGYDGILYRDKVSMERLNDTLGRLMTLVVASADQPGSGTLSRATERLIS
ncbi:MAG: TetR family transcriptional regulator [Marinobacter sp.]|nr:TetR family transcriptional regulator [Marinobacter sp.]